MNNRTTYHEQTDIHNIMKLREVLKTLPPFARDYFRSIDATTSTKTRISYAYDIRVFFQFLLEENPVYKDRSMDSFTVDVLDQMQALISRNIWNNLKVYKGAGENLQHQRRTRLKTQDFGFAQFLCVLLQT